MLPTGSKLALVASQSPCGSSASGMACSRPGSQSTSRVRLLAPCALRCEVNEVGRLVHGEASERDDASILRPDPIRRERQCESHVGNILRISPFQEASGLPKFVDVVRLFMFGDVSPKDSQGFSRAPVVWSLRFESSSRCLSISSNRYSGTRKSWPPTT